MLDNSFIAEFEALAEKYGLPKEGGSINENRLDQLASNYQLLQLIYVGRRSGQYFTSEEIVGDFSALEIARMLKQITQAEGDRFKIDYEGWIEWYNSPQLVVVLRQSLTDALSQRVKKGNGVLVLFKGYGGGDTGRAFIIELPKGIKPQQGGFSEAELDAIIHSEKEAQSAWEITQGNKERNTDNVKSRRPELRDIAEHILGLLPTCWQKVDRYNFVADYMRGAGFLDFMSRVRLMEIDRMDKKQRSTMVRNWLRDSLR